jgi:tol-pal system protein YbgF
VAPGGGRPAGTQLLGVMPADAQGQPVATAAPQPAAAAGALPAGTPKVQYDFAYGLLQQFRIPEAERAFVEFLAKHPNDELSHNARYWLGETYYARSQYQQAAETFLDAYQKAPQGPKAADNMLKLGMSLGRLERKQEACATLAGIPQLFPTAAATLRDQASAERKRLACA